jgi:acetyl-CoA carboxylase biotin carboxylase subunit
MPTKSPTVSEQRRFDKVLVANRGAVAARVLRCLRTLGMRSVAVYSEADRDLPYLAQADETFALGPAAATASYLNKQKLLEVLRESGADAVHPGYGFLAEDAAFAAEVEAAGACFIGPSPRWIEAMGHKTRARTLMARHGMPMGASSPVLTGDDDALRAAASIGYPVLIKPAAGGGGIGMLAAGDDRALLDALSRARSLAQRAFGNGEVYLEKLLRQPRHIEFQVLADRQGRVRHLYERDCSVQRRHQKIIEEAPAPGLPASETGAVADRLATILGELGYDVIGTVEMLRSENGGYGFLEMNTRLQVEHAVTEALTGIDIVAAQIRLAAGESIDAVLPPTIPRHGHAIELRIYAEDPRSFMPSPGPLEFFELPQMPGVRVETGYAAGNQVTPYYDPLLAKLIVHAHDRAAAINLAQAALQATTIRGLKTNLPFLQRMLDFAPYRAGQLHTGLVEALLTSAN